MKKRQGSTLILVLMIFVVLSILATATMSFMVTENKQSIYQKNKIEAYYIARSGAEAVEAAIMQIFEEEKGLIDELSELDEKDPEIKNKEIKLRVLQEQIIKLKGSTPKKVDIPKLNELYKSNDLDVDIKGEAGNLLIISSAKVGKSQQTLEKVIKNTESKNSDNDHEIGKKIEISNAISAKQNIILGDSGPVASIKGSIKSNDKIKVITNGSSPLISGNILIVNKMNLEVSGSGKDTWLNNNIIKLKEENKEFGYSSPLFPNIKPPTIPKNENIDKSGSDLSLDKYQNLVKNTYISSGNIYISGSGDITGDIYTGNGSINISGSGKITGDIYTGNGSINISGSGKITGDIYTGNGSINVDGNADLLGYMYSGDGNINIKGSRKLMGNIYTYSGNIKRDGSGNLTGDIYSRSGDIEINGSGEIKGNIISSSDEDIKLNGNNIINGVIYSTKSDVLFNSSTKVYGAVIGNKVIIKNNQATIEYKESNINTDNIETEKTDIKIESNNYFEGSYYR